MSQQKLPDGRRRGGDRSTAGTAPRTARHQSNTAEKTNERRRGRGGACAMTALAALGVFLRRNFPVQASFYIRATTHAHNFPTTSNMGVVKERQCLRVCVATGVVSLATGICALLLLLIWSSWALVVCTGEFCASELQYGGQWVPNHLWGDTSGEGGLCPPPPCVEVEGQTDRERCKSLFVQVQIP